MKIGDVKVAAAIASEVGVTVDAVDEGATAAAAEPDPPRDRDRALDGGYGCWGVELNEPRPIPTPWAVLPLELGGMPGTPDEPAEPVPPLLPVPPMAGPKATPAAEAPEPGRTESPLSTSSDA